MPKRTVEQFVDVLTANLRTEGFIGPIQVDGFGNEERLRGGSAAPSLLAVELGVSKIYRRELPVNGVPEAMPFPPAAVFLKK